MASAPSRPSPRAWVGPGLAAAAALLVSGSLLLPDAPRPHALLGAGEDTTARPAPAAPRCVITVIEEDQGPRIAGATVRHGAGDAVVTTGSEGTAELPVGAPALVVAAEGFFAGGAALEPRSREVRVALRRAERGARLRLRVEDAGGAPVEGAVVSWKWEFRDPPGLVPTDAERALRVLLRAPPVFAPAVLRGVTDARGDLDVPLPLAGTVTLRVQHSQLGPLEPQELSVDAALLARGEEHLTLTYPPSPRVEVRTRRDGKPVPYCPIELFQGGASPVRLLGARTDETGTVRMHVRTSPGIVLVARPQGLAPAVLPLEGADAGAPLVFDLEEGATLTVKAPGALRREPFDRGLEVLDAASGVRLAAAQPDADESYRFPGLPTEALLHVAWTSDATHAPLAEVRIPPGQESLHREIEEDRRTP